MAPSHLALESAKSGELLSTEPRGSQLLICCYFPHNFTPEWTGEALRQLVLLGSEEVQMFISKGQTIILDEPFSAGRCWKCCWK